MTQLPLRFDITYPYELEPEAFSCLVFGIPEVAEELARRFFLLIF